MKNRPTLLDVAREAGVSRATAARVLAGQGNVGADLADRVGIAARALGYRTNPAARALRRGQADAVAIVAPASDAAGTDSPFVGTPIRAASQTLFAADVQPVLLLDEGRDPSRLVRHLSAGHVDAVIVVLQMESMHLYRALADLPVPTVYIGRPSVEMPTTHHLVDCDQELGGRLAARELLRAGRRELCVIGGPRAYLPSDDRVRGFTAECEAAGVAVRAVEHGDFSLPSGLEAMVRLLEAGHPCDGLFAASDLMAVGAMRALTAAGLQTPSDISVVGFDDTVVARSATPSLTTVRQPFAEMGAAAAALALEPGLAPRPTATTARRRVLATELVRRDSVTEPESVGARLQ
ncbi:LacI family DNA-binding transcriptional regulator [Miniimonas sp. S16]|uniref:LacI family DNA-binding transcriptional regulator n=1 Tax=Miniimonas sp. S16 TaxID=2171623 RepID=UPI000D525C39|nr:LacI family DNA-binding transcriptional regulator [Miniimonas sp. S16]